MDDSLASFIEDVCGDSHLRVEDTLGDGFVRLRHSEAERRQAKHDIRSTEDVIIEMLRNARDAGARNIFLALSREESKRFICMIDDGNGVPKHLHELIFQPRVTSKLDAMHVDKWGVHGRGMALFSIKENACDTKIVASQPGKGSSFFVEVDLNTLSEKTDQSTMPVFSFSETGDIQIRGPHNINRVVSEFAYDSKEQCHVFLGSPSEIVACIYLFGEASLSKTERAFCESPDTLPLVKQLVTASDAAELAQLSSKLGLSISERSARRVLDGEITPALDVLEHLSIENELNQTKKKTRQNDIDKMLNKDRRGLRITPEDSREFERLIKKAYQDLAKKYYLENDIEPKITVSKNHIDIHIDIEKIR